MHLANLTAMRWPMALRLCPSIAGATGTQQLQSIYEAIAHLLYVLIWAVFDVVSKLILGGG